MKMRDCALGLLAIAALTCGADQAIAARERDDSGQGSFRLSARSGFASVLDEARSGTFGLTGSLELGFERQPLRSNVRTADPPVAGRLSTDRSNSSPALDLAPPSVFAFAPPAPNPFEHETMLRFDLPSASRVRIETYDVRGRAVKGLRSEDLGAGRHQRRWEGVDDGGRMLPPGIYLVRIHASSADGGQTVEAVRRVLMLR